MLQFKFNVYRPIQAENDHLERFIEKARAYVGIKKLDAIFYMS